MQVDSPKDYASKVFTLINIALGLDGGDPVPEGSSGSSTLSPQAAESVDAEVVDPSDPWGGKDKAK